MYKHLWLEAAKKLPVNGTVRIVCPKCGHAAKACTANNAGKEYFANCFSCGFKDKHERGVLTLRELAEIARLNEEARRPLKIELPKDFTYEIPLEGQLWLHTCGISYTRWVELGIGWSPYYKRVVIPVYNKEGQLIWLQQRAVMEGQTPKYLQPKSAKQCTYSNFNPDVSKVAVIVEDIASCIRINELPISCDAHAIMGTSISEAQINVLAKYNRVMVWLDPDVAGKRASTKIRRTLNLWTDTVKLESRLDPKKLDNNAIIAVLLKGVEHA